MSSPRGTIVEGRISDGVKLVSINSREGQEVLATTRMALPSESWPEYPRGKQFGHWISTGDHFVLAASHAGQTLVRTS